MIINRREFLKRATALGLSASSAAALLEACGGTSSSPGNGSTATRINLYETIPSSTEAYWRTTLLPPFTDKHSELDLVYYNLGIESSTLLRTKIKAGGSAEPDMAWIASGETGTFVAAGILADVDGWLNSKPAIKGNIIPALNTLATYQGKIWSLPWMTNNTAMWINTDAFAQAGVPIPSQDPTKTWTWDQFAEACKKISSAGKMKGFLMNNGGNGWDAWVYTAWLGTNGGSQISASGDPHFNDQANIETMTYLQSLVKGGGTLYGDAGKGYDATLWYSGKAAITNNGPWNFPDLQAFKKFKFTVVPYPVNKQPATNIGGDQLFLFNNSAAKVAASFAYAEYMLSDDFQVKFNIQSGNLPVTKTATASADYQAHIAQYPYLNGWINSVPYGVARSSLPYAADMYNAFGKYAWDPVILNGADVKQSLDAANSQAAQLKS